MSALLFLLFALAELFVMLFLRKYFFMDGGGVVRYMTAYAFALGMGLVYMGVIRSNGVIYVDFERSDSIYLDLFLVHGVAVVMIYLHAWATPSRWK